MDELVQANLPDAADQDRRKRNRKLFWSAAGVAIATFIGFGWNWVTSEFTVRHQTQVEDAVDREGPAFSAAVRPSSPEAAEVIAFNRPFSAADREDLLKIEEWDEFHQFISSHGGKKLSFPSVDADGFAEVWNINILSDRNASLVITNMRIKGLECKAASYNTVIIEQPQGASDYSGMIYDLTRPSIGPVIIDKYDQHYGKPFFEYKRISLGNGADSAGLRVEVTSGFQDCTWNAFEVTFIDSKGTHKQKITNSKNTFAVHGVAKRPKQVYSLNSTDPLVRDCRASHKGIHACGYPGRQKHTQD